MASLTGQLLIAMPQMQDPFFARSVVYLCAHGQDAGTMGFIVNRTIESFTIDKIYAQLDIAPQMSADTPQLVYFGGPVAPGQGFVLHSPDYREEGTQIIGEEFALTASFDILRAKAKGAGPRQCLLALGYSGWAPGQLESEIKANGWRQPIAKWFSMRRTTANGGAPWPKSASARRIFPGTQASPEAVRPVHPGRGRAMVLRK